MKIIDLLNKIAKGEGFPEKIKYKNEIWEYYEDITNYIRPGKPNTLFTMYYIHKILNDEAEIIEEKEIEPLAKLGNYKVNTGDDFLDKVLTNINERINHLIDKQTEIIDAVNEMRKEK